MKERTKLLAGVGATVAGTVLTFAGAMWAHFTGLSATNNLGQEIYPAIPRGWAWELSGGVVSLTGVHIIMAGIILLFLWEKPMTWARASIGAFLFTVESIILFGIVPNEWLTITQSDLEWSVQNIWFQVPRWLVLNNEVNVSWGAVKDVVSGTYSLVLLGAIAVAMVKYQDWTKKRASGPAVEPVSEYGRPMVKADR